MDYMYYDRTKCIDSLAVSDGIIPFLEGLALYEVNKIMRSDYRAYVIGLNLEAYFEEQFSQQDFINRSILDLSRRDHREKFEEYADKFLDNIPMEYTMD